MLPEKDENKGGLYRKYDIAKADGTPLDPRAEFFILRLDEFSTNPDHINACRKAILAFADVIAAKKPKLALDLYDKYNKTVGPNPMQINPDPHF